MFDGFWNVFRAIFGAGDLERCLIEFQAIFGRFWSEVQAMLKRFSERRLSIFETFRVFECFQTIFIRFSSDFETIVEASSGDFRGDIERCLSDCRAFERASKDFRAISIQALSDFGGDLERCFNDVQAIFERI